MLHWILFSCLCRTVFANDIYVGDHVPQAEGTLKTVFVLAVHGIRTPLYGPFKGDLGTGQFPTGQNDLTTMGRTMMESVGITLNRRYLPFLQSKTVSSSRIVTAYPTALTTTSAEILVGKMFEGLEEVPEVKTSFYDYFDKTHLVYDTVDSTQCPRYVCLRNRVKGLSFPSKHENKFYGTLYKDVETRIDSAEGFYKIYDRIQMEKLNGVPVPEWANGMDPTRSQICKRRYKKDQVGYDVNTSKYLTDPLMKWITSIFQLDPKTFDYDPTTKTQISSVAGVHVHVTEDILPSILGWEMFSQSYRKMFQRPFVVEVGDVVLFEVHSSLSGDGDTKEYIKIFYYSPTAALSFRRFEEMSLDQFVVANKIEPQAYFYSRFLKLMMFQNSFTEQCRLARPWYSKYAFVRWFDTCSPPKA